MGSPRGQGVFVLALIFLVLAFIAFTLRLLTRTLIARNAGRDDVCIAVGLVCLSIIYRRPLTLTTNSFAPLL